MGFINTGSLERVSKGLIYRVPITIDYKINDIKLNG